MTQIRHEATKRGVSSGAVLRRWNAGYRPSTIAHELKCTLGDVESILLAAGVSLVAIEHRRRATRRDRRNPHTLSARPFNH